MDPGPLDGTTCYLQGVVNGNNVQYPFSGPVNGVVWTVELDANPEVVCNNSGNPLTVTITASGYGS